MIGSIEFQSGAGESSQELERLWQQRDGIVQEINALQVSLHEIRELARVDFNTIHELIKRTDALYLLLFDVLTQIYSYDQSN